jgi:hypothetical protein
MRATAPAGSPGVPSRFRRAFAAARAGLGAFRDRLALVLSNGRQDVDSQLVGVRVVNRHELDAGVYKSRHEGQISREPIELGDDQPGLVLAAGIYGPCQLRAVRFLATLHLDELADQLPAPPLR